MQHEFEEYSNYQIEAVIDEWIHGKINREMMKMKLIDHKSNERIAEYFNISPITTQRKIRKMKAVIMRHLSTKSKI